MSGKRYGGAINSRQAGSTYKRKSWNKTRMDRMYADSDEQIQECLNCTETKCSGGGLCMKRNHARLEANKSQKGGD